MDPSYKNLSTWYERNHITEAIDEILHSPPKPPVLDAMKSLFPMVERAESRFNLEIDDWLRLASNSFLYHEYQMFVFTLAGIQHHMVDLDDLVGELMGGWVREPISRVIDLYLAELIGDWVLQDDSRLGNIEAWLIQGESTHKKVLSVMSLAPVLQKFKDTHPQLNRILKTCKDSVDIEIHDALESLLTSSG